MKEMVPEKKGLSLLNLGQTQFKFERRTHFQTLQASSMISRPPPNFARMKYSSEKVFFFNLFCHSIHPSIHFQQIHSLDLLLSLSVEILPQFCGPNPQLQVPLHSKFVLAARNVFRGLKPDLNNCRVDLTNANTVFHCSLLCHRCHLYCVNMEPRGRPWSAP